MEPASGGALTLRWLKGWRCTSGRHPTGKTVPLEVLPLTGALSLSFLTRIFGDSSQYMLRQHRDKDISNETNK